MFSMQRPQRLNFTRYLQLAPKCDKKEPVARCCWFGYRISSIHASKYVKKKKKNTIYTKPGESELYITPDSVKMHLHVGMYL